jgi:nucleoside-diphosphate-sugar epimerase
VTQNKDGMTPKIIGNGMVARAFANGLRLNSNLVIFASGVSNSDCTDPEQFERERSLLFHTLDETPRTIRFLYFGTCSVYDPDALAKAYVIHKMEMEELVLSHPAGCVIRLPQLAGPNAPSNTLLSALVSKIKADEEVQIWSNAVRNIIDVDDVVKIVDALQLEGLANNRVINVANPLSIKVTDLINVIESALHLDARVVLIPKGARYEIDTEAMLAAAESAKVYFGENYLLETIAKYYA